MMTTNHFDVFLSYHWRDHAQVEALATQLREQNLAVFLDRWYLTPGQSWPKKLETELARCRAVVVCIGPGEMGPWQQREHYLAIEWQVAAERQGQTFPVIPVLLPGAEPPLGFLSQNTWVDFRARVDDPVLLHTLVNAIHGEPPGPDAQETVRETLATICPYRGLLYFREEDAPFFFGREAAITQLVQVVQRHNLVAVVGASGSGMSSVVRAGLVPELRKTRDYVWEVATIVPTDRPVHALAAVLMPFLEPEMSEVTRMRETNQLAEDMLSWKTALRDVVDRVLARQPGTDRLFLIADQWEELFTLCRDEAARRCFIDNILEATVATKLSAVLTLRGDFFGRAITDYRPLSDRVQGAQVNLGPMKREELRLAIEEPAKQVGLTFSAGLVDLILEQVGGEPGHLPLVEFVLRRLWEDRQGGELHHAAYRAMGELQGAIAQKAESLFMDLNDEDQRKVQQIFLRLVRPGEGEADTRRRANLGEVGEPCRRLVKQLADERLLVTSQSVGSEEETIEVSHEALIRHWDRLKGWVDADRRFLAWQQRLSTSIKQYEESKRSRSLLLRGLPLMESVEWVKKRSDHLSLEERRFVTSSKNWKDGKGIGIAILTLLILIVVVGTTWLWKMGYSPEHAGLKVRSFLESSISLKPEMRSLAGGSFDRGDTSGRGDQSEKPVRKVAVKPFDIGKFEVTFDEYDRFVIATGRSLPGDQGWGRGRHPVINVSWEDAKAYAEWLSGVTGNRYRLPTEAEWEYAARSMAKNKDDIWAGTAQEELLDQFAVFQGGSTSLVGVKKPNDLGLYDMNGNVWEWVRDCWHDNYRDAPTDGSAWLEKSNGDCKAHVRRGGSWYNSRPVDLRISSRSRNTGGDRSDAIGFRLAQDIP